MILSNKQYELLLKELYKGKVTEQQQKLAVRNVTMAILMLESGLRTTEVVNLAVSDLFLAGKSVPILHLVRGIPREKGRRAIPLKERTRAYIEFMNEYWWQPDAGKSGNYAFYNKSPISHITVTQFRRIINKASINALGYSVRPNMLRRTCAGRLLQETDRQTVMRLLDYKTDQDSFYY